MRRGWFPADERPEWCTRGIRVFFYREHKLTQVANLPDAGEAILNTASFFDTETLTRFPCCDDALSRQQFKESVMSIGQ